ncbi:MAG: hypothetical protein SFY67_19255 [Candidatus Melainabacteria bacterium]|nr:hypothetical protein [Candidatus Melainabacteria bacterium]
MKKAWTKFRKVKTFLLSAMFLTCLSTFAKDSESFKTIANDQHFRIDYSYFCGLPNRYTRKTYFLRTEDLSPQDNQKVRSLVNDSNILNVNEKDLSITDGGPCRTISLCTGAITKKVSWSYDLAPANLRKLADYLDAKATVEKKP